MSETTFIGPMTDKLIESFVNEVKKQKNRDKIMKNVDQDFSTNHLS